MDRRAAGIIQRLIEDVGGAVTVDSERSTKVAPLMSSTVTGREAFTAAMTCSAQAGTSGLGRAWPHSRSSLSHSFAVGRRSGS